MVIICWKMLVILFVDSCLVFSFCPTKFIDHYVQILHLDPRGQHWADRRLHTAGHGLVKHLQLWTNFFCCVW